MFRYKNAKPLHSSGSFYGYLAGLSKLKLGADARVKLACEADGFKINVINVHILFLSVRSFFADEKRRHKSGSAI